MGWMQYTSWKGKEGQLFFGFDQTKKKKKKIKKFFYVPTGISQNPYSPLAE